MLPDVALSFRPSVGARRVHRVVVIDHHRSATKTTSNLSDARFVASDALLPKGCGIEREVTPEIDPKRMRNDGFCIKDHGFCIINDEFCIKNDEFCQRFTAVGNQIGVGCVCRP